MIRYLDAVLHISSNYLWVIMRKNDLPRIGVSISVHSRPYLTALLLFSICLLILRLGEARSHLGCIEDRGRKVRTRQFLVLLSLTAMASPSWALNWTVDSKVSYVRTYDGVTFSIRLADQRCENQKEYFYVYDRTKNETFYSMALAAFLSGAKIRLSYTLDPNGAHCFVDGIRIAE